MANTSKPTTISAARSEEKHDRTTLWSFYFLMGMLGIAVIMLLLALITF